MHDRGDDEEERRDDRNCEYDSIVSASKARRDFVSGILAAASPETALAPPSIIAVGVANAERCIDRATAGAGAVSRQDCDGEHATNEEDVKDEREKGEEGYAAETACQDDCEDGVYDSHA